MTQALDTELGAAQPSTIELSVVLPCLDEEATVGVCVEKATQRILAMGLSGEVIVVDNGSTDSSAERATAAGARVVSEPRRGYGRALHKGLQSASGQVVVLADCDGAHDFDDMPSLLRPLANGADLVVGSRTKGHVDPGAIPWLHRYLGGPALTHFLNLLHRTRVSDAHCGMRSLRRDALDRMSLRSSGMEFASEMIIEAASLGLVIEEVPVHTARRAGGEPKLRTWRDGWRHLSLIVARAMLREASQQVPPQEHLDADSSSWAPQRLRA